MVRLAKRYDLPRAGRELQALMKNPDDLPRVFGLIDALQGSAAERLRAGFEATEEGRSLLNDQPNIVPLLTDRDALRKMPEGSLAHAYLTFVESENISAEGLLEAAATGERASSDDEYRWQRGRMRDTHDLWHAVLGYQGDVLGELSLLAFLLAQHFHPGIALVLTGGFSKGLAGDGAWLVAEGYVRGKRAAWLPSQNWEELLPLPVTEVRERLRVGAPPAYEPLRSSELRARGVLA
jgi:ubiquinone biosynthesis protein COQ4